MPYYRTDVEPLPYGLDGALFPDCLEIVPERAAIMRANQYMIRHCDYLITYNKNRVGNTRKLVAEARKNGLLYIVNIAEG